jgi:hypothetical protein
LALALATGCATIDVYNWEPHALPAGSQPLGVVLQSLHELRNVSWSYGAGDPDPTRRAELAATPRGVTGAARLVSATGTPLDLSYLEISDGVRMVTQLHGVWTVYIYDRHDRLVQMEFNSLRAARLILDAASAIARGQS